jgi:hypothetical protein
MMQTVRNLLELSSDPEKLSLLADITKLVRDLQPGTYPRKELLWLATTAWNRGCSHVKYGRVKKALPFMQAGLELMDFCPELEARKQVSLICTCSPDHHSTALLASELFILDRPLTTLSTTSSAACRARHYVPLHEYAFQ